MFITGQKRYLVFSQIIGITLLTMTAVLLAGCMSIQEAAREGNIEHIKTLLALGTDIDSRTFGGDMGSALHRASAAGEVETVKFLIEHGANVNIKNEASQLPIHYAAENGHTEIVKILLENGAFANPKLGYTNKSVLNIAARRGHIKMAEVLHVNGANVNINAGKYKYVSWSSGDTPLHEAVRAGHIEMVNFLISKGADVNSRGTGSCPPLHRTLPGSDPEKNKAKIKIRHILQIHGADPTFTCNRHQSTKNIISHRRKTQAGFVVELLTGDTQ